MSVTQRMGIGGIANLGLKTFKKNMGSILTIVGWFMFLPSVVYAIYTFLAIPGYLSYFQPFNAETPATVVMPSTPLVVLYYVLLLGVIVFSTMGSILLISYLKENLEGKKVRWQDLLSVVKKRFWPLIGASIMVGIFEIILFLLLIIPGIIFSVYWLFFSENVILRGEGGWQAIKHSMSIVKKRWWRSLGYILSLGVIMWIIMGIVQLITLPLWLFGGGMVIALIIYYIVQAFLTGTITSIIVAWYLNWDKNRA